FAEICVVDQSAGDAGRALSERFGARWLHLDRRGLSHARNAGFAHASGDWLAYPDDDAEGAGDVLARLAAAVERYFETAVVCGDVRYPDGRPMQPGMDRRERVLDGTADLLRTTVSPGLFVRRDWVARVGGFDERFGVGAMFPSGEESDLLFRILA